MLRQFPGESAAQRQVSMNNLDFMVNFCENMMDCRRTLQLDYFGEHFTREQCLNNKTSACDNCLRQNLYKEIDVTDISKQIVGAVQDLCMGRNRATVLQMVDVIKGAETKKIVESGHNNTTFHGLLKTWDRSDIQRIFHKLIIENYLREEIMINRDIPQAYIKIGPKVADLMTPGRKPKLMFAMMEKNQPKAKKMEVTAVDERENELQDKCYQDLLDIAQEIAEQKGQTLAQIMNMQAIREMSKRMPETEAEMLKIPHVTKANFDKYGPRFLKVTIQYSAQRTSNALDNNEPDEDEAEFGGGEQDWAAIGRQASSTSISKGSGTKRKNFGNRWGAKNAKKMKTSSKKKSPAKSRGGGAGRNLLPRPKPQF